MSMQQITHFPVTRSDAPCLKCGEAEFSSCNVTKAPAFITDDAIEVPLTHE